MRWFAELGSLLQLSPPLKLTSDANPLVACGLSKEQGASHQPAQHINVSIYLSFGSVLWCCGLSLCLLTAASHMDAGSGRGCSASNPALWAIHLGDPDKASGSWFQFGPVLAIGVT